MSSNTPLEKLFKMIRCLHVEAERLRKLQAKMEATCGTSFSSEIAFGIDSLSDYSRSISQLAASHNRQTRILVRELGGNTKLTYGEGAGLGYPTKNIRKIAQALSVVFLEGKFNGDDLFFENCHVATANSNGYLTLHIEPLRKALCHIIDVTDQEYIGWRTKVLLIRLHVFIDVIWHDLPSPNRTERSWILDIGKDNIFELTEMLYKEGGTPRFLNRAIRDIEMI